MAEFKSAYKDQEGELCIGEYTFSDTELDYVKAVDSIEEAGRTITDISAAMVLLEGKEFSNTDRIIGLCETPHITLNNGQVVKAGHFVEFGIQLALAAKDSNPEARVKAQSRMEQLALTAQTVTLDEGEVA